MKTDEARSASGSNCPCTEPCPIGTALSAIGGKWKLRIICTLFADGTQRFSELLKKTPGITAAMLTASLRELEADGIVTRTYYTEIPPRVEYSLTGHGKGLWPILRRLANWAAGEDFDGDDTVIRSEMR